MEAANQQTSAYGYTGEAAAPPTPRAASILANAVANLNCIEQVVDALASRTVGLRDTDSAAGKQQGAPVTYAALAGDIATRTERLLQQLQAISSEI